MAQLNLLADEAADRAVLRPIHYLGNKSRALEAIRDAVDAVAPEGAVCDLFSGSGVVSATFGRYRPVVSADVQEYARVLASALLEPRQLPSPMCEALVAHARAHESSLRRAFKGLIEFERVAIEEALGGRPERLAHVLEHGSVVGRTASRNLGDLEELIRSVAVAAPQTAETVLSRYYGGVYFSYSQTAELDGLAMAAREVPPELRDTALAAVLSTASEVVSSVGNHFAQPVRPRDGNGKIKRATVANVARRRLISPTKIFGQWLKRYLALQPSPFAHSIIRGDYREVLEELPDDVAIVYADPPYTRDHYSRFYHVLETISLGDDPSLSSVKIGGETKSSRGHYRADRHQSPFCIKSEVMQAFRELIAGTARRAIPIVISYSPYEVEGAGNRRLMKIEQIESLLQEHYSIVEVRSAGRIAHSKLNADHLNAPVSYEAEKLLIGSR